LGTALSVARPFDFEKYGGVEYRTGEDFRLTLDVYVPKGDGPFPGLLAVHGGSWRSGTKLNWFRHARKLAKAGYVVVAINYRHAPEHKFPAQIHDCKAAVRWMRINASKYKIDTEQIGGVGYSAGGHLVAMLGTSDSGDGLEGDVPESENEISTRLQAVAAGGAPCEFSWISENSMALSHWLGGTPQSAPQAFRMASPMTFITDDDPPYYFFQGTDDWVVPQSSPKKMHLALQGQAIQSTFQAYDGYGHFALFSHVDALDPVIDFFDRTLERKNHLNTERR